MPPNNYQIAIDQFTEEQILADLKTLVTQNTNGVVDNFPEGSFHTALLETQAYQYRQLLRYLQYSPLFLVTSYLNDVLGLPKREGGKSVTAQITFQTPPNSTIRLYTNTVFDSEIGGTLLLNSDLVIPAGTSTIQAQLTIGDGVVSVGDQLALPGVLPLASITIIDADPSATSSDANYGIEGWGDYLSRLSNFVAATPQYTSDSIASLLKAQGVTVTGLGQVDGGGFDVCVMPGDENTATSAIANLSQRYNKVKVKVSEPIAIYPDTVGGKFSATELRRFNSAGKVARCDQPQGKSVYTVNETCYPRVTRSQRYEVGDLVKISNSEYKVVTSGGNLITSIFGAFENGYGRLVRFDEFDPGTYSMGAGYRNGVSYYINTQTGFVPSIRTQDFITSVNYATGISYSVGQVVIAGDWGLVVTAPITFPLAPTLINASAPFTPTQGQAIPINSYLSLFGKVYAVNSPVASFDYGNPTANAEVVYYHSSFTERPIFTRYGLGIFGGKYWDGTTILQQPVAVSQNTLPLNADVIVAGNSYTTSIRSEFNEIDCDKPLTLPLCSYFVST